MFMVYEKEKVVGYLVERSYGFQFVARNAYFATGLASKMDETCGQSEQEVIDKLEEAGLVVKEEDYH
jgi:hypothetical protein